jgi:hypothetical protein
MLGAVVGNVLFGDKPVCEIDPEGKAPPLYINYLALCEEGELRIAPVVTAPTLEKLFDALRGIIRDWKSMVYRGEKQ